MQLISYTPEWVHIFTTEAQRLQKNLGENLLAIHHIGSTAIPGVDARPIIDILLVIKNQSTLENQIMILKTLGYHPTPQSMLATEPYFTQESDPLYHLQIYPDNHPKIEQHLRFRNYLRANPKEAQTYSETKRALASEHSYVSQPYEQGKKDFIARYDPQAAAWWNRWIVDGPSPDTPYPMPFLGNKMVFLKNFIHRPNIMVGDYTYYHDDHGAQDFETKNVIYHHPLIQDKLIIGKFCQIAMGTTFMMNGSHHQMGGISTYPFKVMGGGFENYTADFPTKGDTVVGNDVWFGYQSHIMPGITIGDGAIIGALSMVTKDVPPYTIVGGNPAKIIRQRFDDATIATLLKIQWWQWPLEKIVKNIPLIVGGDCVALKKVSAEIEQEG